MEDRNMEVPENTFLALKNWSLLTIMPRKLVVHIT